MNIKTDSGKMTFPKLGTSIKKTYVEIYRDYHIEKETEPWAIKYGFKYFIDLGDKRLTGKTIDEVKDEIDEYIERNS